MPGKRGNGEGSVRQRPNGLWEARITLDGKSRSFFAPTRAEAVKKLTAFQHDRDIGKPPSVHNGISVEKYLVGWLEMKRGTLPSPRTYDRYREYVTLHLIPALGRHKLASLSVHHVQKLYSEKRATLAPRTVNHIHAVLHNALEHAMKQGLVYRNVTELAEAPEVRKVEMLVWTQEEARAFLRYRLECQARNSALDLSEDFRPLVVESPQTLLSRLRGQSSCGVEGLTRFEYARDHMQELAHGRPDHDPGPFAAGPQTLGQSLHGGMVSHGHHGREGARAAQPALARFGQPWRVMPRAPRRPLLGRQTGIGRSLPGLDGRAHERNLGEHPCRRPRPHSGNRAEQLLVTAQLGGRFHRLLDEVLGLGQFLAQEGTGGRNRGTHRRRGAATLATILLVLHHLLPHLHPPSQRCTSWTSAEGGVQIGACSRAPKWAMRAASDVVRLGAGPPALGRGGDAGRVDDADLLPRLSAGQRQRRAVRTGRFQAGVDPLAPLFADPPVARREARRIHGEGPLRQLSLAEQGRVDLGFGHRAASTRRGRLPHRLLLTAGREILGATRVHPGSPLSGVSAVSGPPIPSDLQVAR